MFNLSINRENEALQEAADKAVRVAKKEELKREVNLAYDDPEGEEYQEISQFKPLLILIGCFFAAVLFVLFIIRTFITPN